MPTTATPNVLTDPGYLFRAPLGTAVPTNTVAGSKFTDAWAAAWVSVGATDKGSDFQAEVQTEQVKVAEFLDPIKIVTTGRSSRLAFAMADFTLTKLSWALNGGTNVIVSGTGATQLNKFTPAVPGVEVRCMLGWESLDSTVRLILYQAFQTGTINPAFAPAPDRALIAVEFGCEVPASGNPWEAWSAGAARA
jgi:hypothetical protein